MSITYGTRIQILGAKDLVDSAAVSTYLSKCQFKFGGIAKAPESRPGASISSPYFVLPVDTSHFPHTLSHSHTNLGCDYRLTLPLISSLSHTSSLILIIFTLLDPYHTYLSLAAVSLLGHDNTGDESWDLPLLDPLLNATKETVLWIRSHVPQLK